MIRPYLVEAIVYGVRSDGMGYHDILFPSGKVPDLTYIEQLVWQRIYAATKYNGNAEEVRQILSH